MSLPDISAEHPEVLASVEKQMVEAEKVETPITDGMLVEAVKQGIAAVETAHKERGTPPLYVCRMRDRHGRMDLQANIAE